MSKDTIHDTDGFNSSVRAAILESATMRDSIIGTLLITLPSAQLRALYLSALHFVARPPRLKRFAEAAVSGIIS
jgi:hypothetical protein